MTRRTTAALLLALPLGACGADDATTHEIPALDAAGGSILLEKEPVPAPAWHAENRERRDAEDDDWRGEALTAKVYPALDAFLEALLTGDEAGLDAVLAPDFRGAGALRPAALETVYSSGGTTVQRGTPAATLVGRDGLAELGAALLAPFVAPGDGAEPIAEAADVERHLETTTVRVISEDEAETVALLHLEAHGAGGALQQNLSLRCTWALPGGDETVRLRSIVADSFEEVRTERPLFVEVTDHAFGAIPRFREDFLRGIPDYRFRTDILMGDHLTGMQGFALGDVNGDGLDDMYVAQPGGLMNRLFLRRRDGTVEDVSLPAGVAFKNATRSALIVDLDNDGDQDLAFTIDNVILLAFNDGTGRFVESVSLRLEGDADVYTLCAADPDGDGDLDLYACRWSHTRSRFNINDPPLPYHDANNGPPNVYWRQDGPRAFTDATAEVGLDVNNTRFSYAAVWEDLDDDGDVDLYVANDFGRNNLFINDGGRFTDTAEAAGAEDRSSGMGVTSADFDLDGDRDLYVSNMWSSAGQRIVPQYADRGEREGGLVDAHYQFASGNTLLSNNGDGTFDNVTREAGVSVGGWAWGAKFLDLDNDGYSDLYSPSGYITNADTVDL
jgi:hypothetical protein